MDDSQRLCPGQAGQASGSPGGARTLAWRPAGPGGARALHRAGDAHSVEVWDGEELAGGVYGVDSGGVFTGESMFYRKPNGSKLALLHLIEHLRSRGATWLDCQVMTPHMEAFGARLITRSRFLDMLEAAQAKELTLF